MITADETYTCMLLAYDIRAYIEINMIDYIIFLFLRISFFSREYNYLLLF